MEMVDTLAGLAEGEDIVYSLWKHKVHCHNVAYSLRLYINIMHLAKLQNAWQELWANAANRDVINMFIDLGTTILNLINDVGGLQFAFAALFSGTVVKGLFNANSLLVKYVQLLNSSKSASEVLTGVFERLPHPDGLNEIKKILSPATENTKDAESAAKVALTNEETEALERLNEVKRENAEASALEAEANQQATTTSEMKAGATVKETEAEIADTGSNTAEVVSEEAVDKAKQEGIITSEALTATQEQETASQMKDIVTDTQQTASQQGLNATKAASSGGMFATIGSMATSPFFWIPAAIIALTTIHGIIKRNNQELIDGGKKAASAWTDTEQSLSGYEQKYKDLTIQLQNQKLSETEQLNIKQQLFDLQKQITEEYGKSAEGINLVNGNLDTQLEKIRQIQREEAKRNYQDNTKEYDNAIEKMSNTVSYGVGGLQKGYVLTLDLDYGYEDLNNKLIEDANKAGFDTRITDDNMQAIFTLKENAEDSDKALHALSDSIAEVKDEVGKDWDNTYFDSFNSQLSDAKSENESFLSDFQDTYYTGLKGKLADEPTSTGYDLLFDYEQKVKEYNEALLTKDDEKIQEVKQSWEELIQKKNDYLGTDDNAQYSPLFNRIDESLNQTLIDAYDVRQKMSTENNKTLIESAFGTYQQNKKVSKDLQKQVMSAADNVLKEWKQANKNGKQIDMGSTAMLELAKAAKNANIPVSTIIKSLQDTGQTSALQSMLDGTRVTVEDLETAMYDADSAIAQLASETFGITIDESPKEVVDAFIDQMGVMVGAVSESTSQSSSSLDSFFKNTSAKIEMISSLTSTLQKGQAQTGLTFTKTQDEQGNDVASEVKTIIDAYKDLEGYDLGSLFEETATGIKLNYDAYRALAQEEEAETKRQYKLQRAALENQLAVATTTADKDRIKQQITELDMLSSAYDGATSALAKYLNQQNAADYGDTYAMLRDTTIKRADELMNKGLVGTEEFRSIAQLFSFDSLATADANKVVDNYLAGYEKVKKFFTEDNFTGMKTFADELTTLDEKFGSFTKETIDGEDIYKFEASDDQIALLAEHYGVSVDLIESLFDQLRAMGFNLHLYRDGGFEDFEKLDKQIEESKESLKGLKEVANDPNLIPSLDFTASDLDTPEELKKQIQELEDLQTHLTLDSEPYKEAQKIIDDLREKLGLLEENDEFTPKVTTEGFDQANDILSQLETKEKGIREMGDLNLDYNIEDDGSIDAIITQISSLPTELQTYIMGQMDIMGFNPETDGDKIGEYIRQRLSTGEPVVIQATPEFTTDNNPIEDFYESGVDLKINPSVDPASVQQVQEAMPDGIDIPATPVFKDLPTIQNGIDSVPVDVKADPASIESAKQETTDGISSAEPEVSVHAHLASSAKELEPLATLGFNGEADFQINVGADTSQANEAIEETKEEAEKPVETDVHFNPENTVQDAANQAGAQQGVNTTTTETKVTNEEIHTTATADTSQIDTAKQTMSGLQALSGSTVSVSVGVSGMETIDSAKTNIEELIQKDKSKVTVTLIGNTALFNKAYLQANSALNSLASKKTEPKISADNSSLKDKVSEAKSKLNSIDNKKVHITASNSGFTEISNWKHNTYDNLHDKSIKITTHYSYTGDPKMGKGGFQGSAHNQGTVVSKGRAYASGTLSGDWGLPKAEKGALINELGSEIVVKKIFYSNLTW